MAGTRMSQAWTTGLVAAAVALATLGAALAQAPAGKKAADDTKQAKGKVQPEPAKRPAPRKKAPPNARDPLAEEINAIGKAPLGKAEEKGKAAEPDAKPAEPLVAGSYHFTLKIHAYDDAPLAASYYPATKPDTTAAVVMLVHEKDRSRRDFEDPIAELKGKGLAEHLQDNGFAVLSVDLRGHGANERRATGDRDWRAMVDDLEAVYHFLIDRHNRGEMNVAKLGVIALGEGANLVGAWAYQPGGAVSSEGRVTDLSSLTFVSPLPEGSGYPLAGLMNALGPRIPVLLMAGERDARSHDAVKKVRPNVEKVRQNRVEIFPSSLRAYTLLRLEPRATGAIDRFLEATLKLRSTEWEPRYNLTPVSISEIQVVRHTKPIDASKEAEVKPAEAPKPKAKDDAPGKDERRP